VRLERPFTASLDIHQHYWAAAAAAAVTPTEARRSIDEQRSTSWRRQRFDVGSHFTPTHFIRRLRCCDPRLQTNDHVSCCYDLSAPLPLCIVYDSWCCTFHHQALLFDNGLAVLSTKYLTSEMTTFKICFWLNLVHELNAWATCIFLNFF